MKKNNTAPTTDQILTYNLKLAVAFGRSGLDYETGPRRGQQLAAKHATRGNIG